jgi:hypothetical protein
MARTWFRIRSSRTKGYSISRSEFGFSGLLDEEEGTEIGRLLVEPSSAELQVYMEFKPSFGIAFGDRDSPIYGQPADGLLQVLYKLVQKIALELFDRPGKAAHRPGRSLDCTIRSMLQTPC